MRPSARTDALRHVPADDCASEVDDGRDLARALDRRRRVVLAPRLVAAITPFDSTPVQRRLRHLRADGPFACPSGLTPARFSRACRPRWRRTRRRHVACTRAETAAGQAKIFVRNSPDGLHGRPSAGARCDSAPPATSSSRTSPAAAGVISAVFQDSRNNPAYSPGLPPGNCSRTARTPATCRSRDPAPGRPTASAGAEQQVSTRRQQPELGGPAAAASHPRSSATTTTSRAAGSRPWSGRLDRHPRPRRPGATRARPARDDDADGFDGFQTCTWCPTTSTPRAIARRRLPTPVSHGALDQNVYIAP